MTPVRKSLLIAVALCKIEVPMKQLLESSSPKMDTFSLSIFKHCLKENLFTNGNVNLFVLTILIPFYQLMVKLLYVLLAVQLKPS